MRNGTYYLNNSGSKWVVYEKGVKPKIKIIPDQFNKLPEAIERTAIEFHGFGNFAAAVYSYKGKRYSTLNYELIRPD